jgi:hypothetical protein
MNLTPIKQNMNEIKIGAMRILFSYKTPVAATLLTQEGMEYHVTDKKWSNTTTRHINSWMPKEDRIEHPQEWFDALLSEVK